MRRATKVVAGAAAALTVAAALALPGAEASGDATIVVRGASLPAAGRSQLTMVGCSSVFGRTSEALAPMIGVAPGGPAGKRSLAFDLAGGNAVGPVSYVDDLGAVTVASVSVYSSSGPTGVAYVGYQAPEDVGTTLMWIGRADLSGAAGQWTAVDVRGLGYSWTQYDMSTHEAVATVGSSGIPAFVQAMGGSGAGFYAIGFGCDGTAFNTDAWRIGTSDGTTTYDFEGLTTSTSIDGPSREVQPGTPVTLSGHVVSGSAGVTGRVVLEAKQPNGSWETADVAPGPNPSAVVRPTETTTYRWRFFDRGAYEGSVSDPFTVTVADPDDPTEPPPSEDPTDPASGQPTDQPADQPTDEPSAPASSEPPAVVETTPPADPVTPEPTPDVVEPPAEQASQPPADPPASQQSDSEQPAGGHAAEDAPSQ